MPKIKELQAQNPTVSYLFISMDKQLINGKKVLKKH
jgi:hypothetical protein